MSASMDRRVVRKWSISPKAIMSFATGTALALVVTAVVLLDQGQQNVRVPVNTLNVATVEQGVFHDLVPLRGQVVPRDIVYVDAQEGGRVERVAVRSGDVVEPGELLIEFGNTALQLEVIDREAVLIQQINALRSSQMQLEQTRMANEKSLAELDHTISRLSEQLARRQALGPEGFVSIEERQDLLLQLDHLKHIRPLLESSHREQERLRVARLPEIEAGLIKLNQNLEITRNKLDGLLVRAPIGGRISGLDLMQGEMCERGKRIAQITPDTGVKVVAKLDEYYVPRARSGQKAVIEYARRQHALSIKRVLPDVHEGQFEIELEFDEDSPPGLVPGQALQGELRLGEDRPAKYIPAGPFLEQTGGNWIFVMNPDGAHATRRPIKPGQRSAAQLEILDGLEVGDFVVVSSYRTFDRALRIEVEK